MFTIEIVAFGKVSEYLPELFKLEIDTYNDSMPLNQVLELVAIQYPMAVQALEKCACAIEDNIISRNHIFTQNVQLVILSPVAGG